MYPGLGAGLVGHIPNTGGLHGPALSSHRSESGDRPGTMPVDQRGCRGTGVALMGRGGRHGGQRRLLHFAPGATAFAGDLPLSWHPGFDGEQAIRSRAALLMAAALPAASTSRKGRPRRRPARARRGRPRHHGSPDPLKIPLGLSGVRRVLPTASLDSTVTVTEKAVVAPAWTAWTYRPRLAARCRADALQLSSEDIRRRRGRPHRGHGKLAVRPHRGLSLAPTNIPRRRSTSTSRCSHGRKATW